MKQLFVKYKVVIQFLGVFLGSYVLLSLLYGFYLHISNGTSHTPDVVTRTVAQQSSAILKSLGYNAAVIANNDQPSMQLWVNQHQVGTIIEGCNAISIIILFIAFVLSFASHWKKTVLFLLGGAVLIYSINIVRIAILAMALYQYPQYQEVLHTVVFPGIIYGLVFLLWVFWVRSNTKKNTEHSIEGEQNKRLYE
ncbi:MAG: exosortase family protein XrtF [Flavobacteriaceae bacterium]